MAKCRPIYRGGRRHRTDMSVVVPITLSCRPRVLPDYKVTWNTSTTDIGAGTDTDFIGACTPGLTVMHPLLSWRSYGFSEFILREANVSINLIYLMYFFQFPFVSIAILTAYTYSISLCSKCQRPDSCLERVYGFVPERFRRDISVFQMQRNGRMAAVRIQGATRLFFRPSVSGPLQVLYTTDTITEVCEFNCTGIYS